MPKTSPVNERNIILPLRKLSTPRDLAKEKRGWGKHKWPLPLGSGSRRNRTSNRRLKRPLLCQLSYGPQTKERQSHLRTPRRCLPLVTPRRSLPCFDATGADHAYQEFPHCARNSNGGILRSARCCDSSWNVGYGTMSLGLFHIHIRPPT